MTSPDEQSFYGWSDAAQLEHHGYTLPAIESLLPGEGLTVLDAGCGNGVVAAHLAGLGHRVTAFDASSDGIEQARLAHPGIRFEVLSVYDDLSTLVDQVDLVVSSEVIEHLYSPERFLANLLHVIRPGGWLILTTPYHGYLKNLALSVFDKWDKHHTVDWEGGHIKFFSQCTLEAMLRRNGFSHCEYNNCGRLPWLWKSMVCRAQRVG